MSNRGRYWCFTLNNYTEEELQDVRRIEESNEDVTYVCFGREVAESGTPHLQGYLEFKQKIRLGGVRRLRGMGRAHLELRRGTQDQAIDYCKKDGRFEEFGVRFESRRGARSDLDQIKELLDGGATEEKIAESHFGSWVRYRKSFAAYRGLKFKRMAREVNVYAIWGLPGVGKTRIIFEKEKDLFIVSDPSLKWFDGYDGEESILIDDYRGGADGSFLLRLLDRYPLQLPIKGSYVPLQATKIFITSNMPPPWDHNDIEGALSRRIKSVTKISLPIDFEDRDTVETYINKIYVL